MAARLGVELEAQVADLRNLTEAVRGPFDVVCALDNALPHLDGEAEVSAALDRGQTMVVGTPPGFKEPANAG